MRSLGAPTPAKDGVCAAARCTRYRVRGKSEREFDQTADLDGEATQGPLIHAADFGAGPIPDLEFDQTLGW